MCFHCYICELYTIISNYLCYVLTALDCFMSHYNCCTYVRQNCGILYRCCSLHKIIFCPFKRYSLILYGKVVIGLKVYVRKSHGGLGLVHILSRLHAFKLKFIPEYWYYDSHSCFWIANVFLEEFNIFDILNSYSFLCM